MVADTVELEKMDASEIHARRLNAKEVISAKICENCVFPVAQVLRTSTLIEDNPERGQVQEDFLGESDGSPPSTRQDPPHDDGEARTQVQLEDAATLL